VGESLLEKAKEWRDLVLLAELGGWLHDLGKLSSDFVQSMTDQAYATGEEAEAIGEGETVLSASKKEWKHGQVFSDEEPHDGRRVSPKLKQTLQRSLTGSSGWLKQGALGTDDLSLENLVAGHHAPWDKLPALPWMQGLLVFADRDDSSEDEYNAVNILQRAPMQGATVFGREEPLAKGDLTALDKTRFALYPELEETLSAPRDLAAKRGELWGLLQGVMCHGLGKTQRAANDVRLDQHAWGVATRFKALLMRDLLDPPRAGQIRHTFRLLTVWWNWWELVTPFARLSDVVGRQVMLERLRAELRRATEEEYALGNRVYEDDNGVHFLVADLDWGDELESLIREEVNRMSDGEVQPVVCLGQSTRWVTDVVDQMKKAAREVPIIGRPAWVTSWETARSNEVCPVCQRRPLEGERDLCEWCETWRGEGIRKRLGKGTVWTSEIADDTGRVALVVARFDLERWLDGTMLHTLFITSPQDIAHLYPDMQDTTNWRHLRTGVQRLLKEGSLESLGKYQADVEGARRKLQQSEKSQIPPERQRMMRTEAKHQLQEAVGGFWAALIAREMDRYGGEKGRRIREMMASLQATYPQEEHAFLLGLARKNPSASRLLRVWQTTEEFLKIQADGLEKQVEERRRAVFTLEPKPRPGIYTAEVLILGRADLFVRPDGEAQTVECLKEEQVRRLQAEAPGQTLQLVSRESGKPLREPLACRIREVQVESYLPYQVITVSPNLLLAMVPADQAMQVAEELRSAYVAEFGKVQGRLPFHAGLIFMDAHYPMFAALDTARRLAETFDHLDEELVEAKVEDVKETGDGYNLALKSNRFGEWTWYVPALRGDGETDWYHPYFLVRGEQGMHERGMSLWGPEGRWVHVSELQGDDQIAFWPNLFDFLFLDTVSRRLDARVDSGTKRRPHPLLGRCSPRPYLLEGARHLREVWEAVCSVEGMSESKLTGATSLLARKWEDWGLAKGDEHRQTWEWLARETVLRDLGNNQGMHDTILNAILDGTFFDVVELYRHVLKKKVEAMPSARTEEAKG
jgi:hypothetical protein